MQSLRDIARDNRAGAPVGIPAYCTANADVLRVILRRYARDDAPILIEASAGAVNQSGGHAGMTPAGFRNFLDILAAGEGIDPGRIVLGGTRLGPGPWRTEPAASAMARAVQLVEACVDAGYQKLHFDTSMACAEDPAPSIEAQIARAAVLCQAAERAAGGRPLLYAIGTATGASRGRLAGDAVPPASSPAEAHRLFDLTERAFTAADIKPALERIVAVAVDPGTGFSAAAALPFDPGAATALAESIFEIPNAVFETQAADYLSEEVLRTLLAGHVAILQVGPELGAALRQAAVAMAHIEVQLDVPQSNLLNVLDDEMALDPAAWQQHLPDGQGTQAMRIFGLGDPLQAYWARPRVAAALRRLSANIDAAVPASGLLLQYAPQLAPASSGRLPLSQRIVDACVGPVVEKFRAAASN